MSDLNVLEIDRKLRELAGLRDMTLHQVGVISESLHDVDAGVHAVASDIAGLLESERDVRTELMQKAREFDDLLGTGSHFSLQAWAGSR